MNSTAGSRILGTSIQCPLSGSTSLTLLSQQQGFFIFFHPPIYAWWLSVAAIPLNMSWSLHNVIAWIKIKPFLSRPVSLIFIGTVILVQPYWVVEIYANFTYFHNVNRVFLKTRPWEALCRDPWWVATTVFLFYNIKMKCEFEIFSFWGILGGMPSLSSGRALSYRTVCLGRLPL